MRTYFGCSGWHYDDWKGRFYPGELETEEWLAYYSERFNSVEVNNTFYREPKPGTIDDWHRESSYPFKFSLKGHRYITHQKKLNDVGDSIRRMYDLADRLRRKFGCLLWQLPPNLHRDDERLKRFCRELDTSYRNVIEFRHASWFDAAVFDILEDHGIAYCMISAHGFDDFVRVTSDTAYMRFHGKAEEWYRYQYRKNELRTWAEALGALPADQLYVHFNNDYEGHAIENCRTLRELMEK